MKTLVDYRRRHVLKISKSSGSGFGRKYREPMWYVLGVGQLKKGKKTEQDSDEWRKWKNNWTVQHEQTDHGTLTHTKLPTTGQHCIIIGRGGYITTCVLGTGISCCVTYLKINEKHNERIETRSDTVLRNIFIYPSLCTAAVIRERTNRSPRRIMVGPITVRGMEYTYVRESCCYMLCNDRESQHRAYVPGRAVRTVRRGERKKKNHQRTHALAPTGARIVIAEKRKTIVIIVGRNIAFDECRRPVVPYSLCSRLIAAR